MQTAWRHLGDVPTCADARSAVVCGDAIYVAGADGGVARLDPTSLTTVPIPTGGWQTRLLAAARGRLYAFDESGPLYALDPAGGHERLDGDWSEVTVATGAGDQLYAAGRTLYAVEADGSWRQLGDTVWTPKLLVAGERDLFCLEENGGLYRVDLFDDSPEQLDGDWSDMTAGAIVGKVLCVTSESGWMYAVTGDECIPLEQGAPAGTRFLFVQGSSLYALETSGALHALALS